MRDFLLYSRVGRTDAQWRSMHDAGRLDITYECIVASLFLSHGLRRNVEFNAILNGPPKPPMQLRIDGKELFDVRTDAETWNQILRKVLSGKPHPGISLSKNGFESLLKERAQTHSVYVLEETGKNVTAMEIGDKPLFVLGDHVGLPKNAERFALRFGEKVSLGKTPYLAASCITVVNYMLDLKEKGEIVKP